jgi:hypothetical protein
LRATVAAVAGTAALRQVAANPIPLEKRGCLTGVDVLESPKGYKYALATADDGDPIDCSNMAKLYDRAINNCSATELGYDAGAHFWHITRSYYGSVSLHVETYHNNDTEFQQCLDRNAKVVKKGAILGYAIGGGVAGGVIVGVLVYCACSR